jgi:prophage antirepressor-like protein
VVEHAGDWWFVAKDVCKVLGYTNSRDAIAKHCKAVDDVAIRDAIGREQKTTIIPERDLYRLIMRSKLPAAEKFENWVVSEVLPSVRKHGVYMSRLDGDERGSALLDTLGGKQKMSVIPERDLNSCRV